MDGAGSLIYMTNQQMVVSFMYDKAIQILHNVKKKTVHKQSCSMTTDSTNVYLFCLNLNKMDILPGKLNCNEFISPICLCMCVCVLGEGAGVGALLLLPHKSNWNVQQINWPVHRKNT